MNFLYENINIYEILNYYKDLHKYFNNNNQNIYKILKNLKNEIIIQDNKEEEGDFSNFYFFYIQNIKPIKKNLFQLVINNANDFLTGLNFSKCDIGSDIRIILTGNNIRKKIFRILINKKNKDNIFYPINNKDFFPFFLTNDNVKLILQSNKHLKEIDCIYIKLHRDYSNKFLNFGSYILNFRDNTYFEFKDYNVKILHSNKEIYPNNFLFYWNLNKYYGIKILKFFKLCLLKKEIKKTLIKEYNLYDDIINILCNFI